MFPRRSIVSSLVLILILVGVFVVVIYRQDLQDYWKYNAYEPNNSVANLAERSGMSDRGKFYFYVAKPELETAESFNQDCRRSERGSPILGCYNPSADTIHIYDIDSQELDGVKEVTAAHEMLHVVFARLNNSELSFLTEQLESAYLKIRTEKLDERMAYYQRAAPGSRVNELHSIIGTEYADIGPELEDYYNKYFDNRQRVVQLHSGYSQKFESIEQEINLLTTNLQALGPKIESEKRLHSASVNDINVEIETFNRRASGGYFQSETEFRQARSQLNARISALESKRLDIEAMVNQYNSSVNRLNELGAKMDQLQKGLDSLETVDGSVEKT